MTKTFEELDAKVDKIAEIVSKHDQSLIGLTNDLGLKARLAQLEESTAERFYTHRNAHNNLVSRVDDLALRAGIPHDEVRDGKPPTATPDPDPEKWYWTLDENHWDPDRDDNVGGPFPDRATALSSALHAEGQPFWVGRRDPIPSSAVAGAMFDIEDAIEDVNLWLSDNAGLEDPEFDIPADLKKDLEDQIYGVLLRFFEKHKLYGESWVVDAITAHNEPVKWREVLDPGKRGWPATGDRRFQSTNAEILAIANTRRTALSRTNREPDEVRRYDDAYVAAVRELGGEIGVE